MDADVDTVAGSFFMALASCGLVKSFIEDVNFSPIDPKVLAVASCHGCIDIIDIARKTRNHRIDGHLCANWSPDGLHIVTRGKTAAGVDYFGRGFDAHVVEVGTGKIFQPGCTFVAGTVFADNNTLIVAFSGECQKWTLSKNLETGEIQGELVGRFQCGPVRSLAWGRDYVSDNVRNQRRLAIAMGLHPRLGERSLFQGCEDLILDIVNVP